MWIKFKHESTGRIRSFNLSVGDKSNERNTSQGKWIRLDSIEESKEENKKEISTTLSGYAVLIKDKITGHRMWATFNAKGKEQTNLSPLQPLVFPVEKLALGTKVELHLVQ